MVLSVIIFNLFLGLVKNLQVLESYLVIKKFENASKEASWSAFHKNISSISIEGIEPSKAIVLATHVFKLLVARVWAKEGQGSYDTVTLSDADCDVIAYIAGANVNALMRRHSGKENQIFSMLTCCQGDAAVSNRLIAIQDRGGLTYITESAFAIYKAFEITFQTNCQLNNYTSKQIFTQEAVKASSELFHNLVIQHEMYEDTLTDEVIVNVLTLLVDIYFKTRIHHRCKVTAEEFKKTKAQSKKGLRTTLKNV